MPHWYGVLEAVEDPLVNEIWVIKSAQVGWTELLLTIMGYYIAHDPCPQLMIQPTLEVAESISKDRLAPMIADTPVLADKILPARSRDSGNTLLHKKYPGGSLTLAGANSPSSLRARISRIFYGDEVDDWPAVVGEEGDPFRLGVKRTQTYRNLGRSKVFAGSTPLIKGTSRVEAGFATTDQCMYWVPCPHCDELQVLTWARFVWPKGQPKKAAIECRHCAKSIEEKHKHDMTHAGQWIPTKRDKETNELERSGAVRDGKAGFSIWEVYSPFSSFGLIAESFIDAKDNPDTLQVFTNTVLGETWEEPGEQIEVAGLTNRAEQYDAEPLPAGTLLLTCGVDVQADRLEYEIIAWGNHFESWGIRRGIIEGDPDGPAVWTDLDQVLLEQFETVEGDRLGIAATAVDAGFLTVRVLEFCRHRFERRVFPTKGIATPNAPILQRPRSKKASQKAAMRAGRGQFLIGTHQAKATVFSRLRIAVPGAGYCHFPTRYSPEFYDQLTAEKAVTRYKRGYPVIEWVKLRARNEALDLRVLNLAAVTYLNPVFSVLAKKRAGMAPGPTEPAKPPPAGPVRRRPAPRRNNWATRK